MPTLAATRCQPPVLAEIPLLTVHQLRRVLAFFFLATYFVLLAITWDGIDFVSAANDGAFALSFAIVVWLTYGLIYLLPALLIVKLADWLAHRNREHGRKKLFYALAVSATAATTLFFYANAKLYTLYGFFVNSFVINLVATPGGLESLGASNTSNATFALIAIAFIALQVLLLATTLWGYRRYGEPGWLPDRFFLWLFVVFAVATVGERAVYAYSSATGVASVSSLTQRIPYYLPITARGLLGAMGVKVKRDKEFKVAKGNLVYPLNPLAVKPPAKPLNIVWLVSESLRADMLDAEIMPNTWEFSQSAWRFKRHYSGGNGTRVGVFTMFTGIPGNYWFPFLAERKGAAVIDVLRDQGYQMNFYTSAKFSYPEFDSTIFAKVPSEQLHDGSQVAEGGNLGWELDRKNVARMLRFIDDRDKSKPFFAFMFFESPHARYYFPPESVIRKPYPEDINYFNLSREKLANEMPQIKNRYINSVHHLDSQFGRVIDHLKKNGLLDSTIVIMLGDHGEEFMEKGRWGHNSAFTDEQTRTPFVLWVPGMKTKEVDGMSNHMDVIPTIMPLLGVTNPARDYSTGYNLLAGEERKHAVLAEWSSTAYMDHDVKIAMPLAVVATQHPRVTGPHDEPLSEKEQDEAFARKAKDLSGMMEELGRYVTKSGR